MQLKKLALCASAGVLALAVACSNNNKTPVSPTPDTGAAADGSTLKATAPSPVSPINGAQPTGGVVLVATKAQGKFADINLSYEFQVLDSSNTVVYDKTTPGVGHGPDQVQHTVEGSLAFDQPHTWRARAVFQGAVGPWSSSASFRSPAGGYIRGSEVFDPLTNGETVGRISGPTRFIPGQGIELIGFESHVTYVLPQTLTDGEFSLMVTGIDEGSPGGKTKVMSMAEGFGDVTPNDYRFTFEKRGRDYSTPGAVTWRIITGDASNDGSIKDGVRVPVSFSDEQWYFWKMSWSTGRASVEVREGGPTGRVIYAGSRATNGHPYRPVPHVIYLGQPIGRGGAGSASIPGAIYKDVWVSGNPRPTFPGVQPQP